ncbi:phage tail protein [Paenibacillus sp. USHLN196]|uniref:phage tail protein n=1 Tax=Paenibacillus sp. USHLN196 TaxID=3081291 RepID=UPI0030175578
MAFTQKLPEWNATGVEPSETQKQTGFQPGVRPPAQWFNWHLNWSYLALKELQEKAAEKSYVDAELETIQTEIQQLQEDVQNADIPDASLTVKGKVQLSNKTNGTSESLAPTEKALGLVMTEATAAKQLGVEQKANVVATLNSIGVSASTSETWAQLIAKMAGVVRATGNATAAQVLSGATFSNASGNGRTGTMPNRGGGAHNAALSTEVWQADRTFFRAPDGYYDGQSWVFALTPDLHPSNIRFGKSILGVAGTLNEGPKYATGTATRSVNQVQFYMPNGEIDYSRFAVTVTGLTFHPNRIMISIKSGNERFLASFYDRGSFNSANYGFARLIEAGLSYDFRLTESTANGGVNFAWVSDQGFQLPMSNTSYEIIWEAFRV